MHNLAFKGRLNRFLKRLLILLGSNYQIEKDLFSFSGLLASIALDGSGHLSLKYFIHFIFVEQVKEKSAKLDRIMLVIILELAGRYISDWKWSDL